jgi:integrase
MVLNWASKSSRKYIDGNPWDEIGYLPEKGRERTITDDEFGHLLAQCRTAGHKGAATEFREILTVLRYTTMRPGELRMLRWTYIEWENHRIAFPPNVIKTRDIRNVTLPADVEQVLRLRMVRLECEHGERVSGFVFPGGDRADSEVPMDNRVFSRRVNRLVKKCVRLGLVEQERGGGRIVAYATRHTRISELVAAGLPLKSVMDEAGHKNIQTTQRYTHLSAQLTADLVRGVPCRIIGVAGSENGHSKRGNR